MILIIFDHMPSGPGSLQPEDLKLDRISAGHLRLCQEASIAWATRFAELRLTHPTRACECLRGADGRKPSILEDLGPGKFRQ
jgi:hypothetical protein